MSVATIVQNETGGTIHRSSETKKLTNTKGCLKQSYEDVINTFRTGPVSDSIFLNTYDKIPKEQQHVMI